MCNSLYSLQLLDIYSIVNWYSLLIFMQISFLMFNIKNWCHFNINFLIILLYLFNCKFYLL